MKRSEEGGTAQVWMMISTLIVLASCIMNLVAVVRQVPPPPRTPAAVPRNVAMRLEQRLADVRAALRDRTVPQVIGYVADLPAEQLAGDFHGMEELFLTQFALAPWVVDARAERPAWLLANLQRAATAERVPAGFEKVADFGPGLSLWRRAGP